MPLNTKAGERPSLAVARRTIKAALLATISFAAWSSASGSETDRTQKVVHAGSAEHSSPQRYRIPQVVLVNQDGRRIPFGEVLPSDTPVVLTFIYTRCGTLCPLLSATLAALRKNMGGKANSVRVVTISIDPQYDTPERLHDYAARLGAGSGWQFYTGETADVDQVLRAFDAYAQVKEDHRPLIILRAAHKELWTRIDRNTTAETLTAELMRLGTRVASGR